jgi:hypothetical protein
MRSLHKLTAHSALVGAFALFGGAFAQDGLAPWHFFWHAVTFYYLPY